MQDISSAVQEISDRVQHGTSILGTALENTGRAVLDLQTGQEALRSGMEQLQAEVLRQQQILVAITQHGKENESKSAQHEKDIQMLKEHLEGSHHQQQASQLQLDRGVQLQAALAARVEQLEGQVQRLSLATEPQPVSNPPVTRVSGNVDFQAIQAELQRVNALLEVKEQEKSRDLEWQNSLQESVVDAMLTIYALESVAATGPQVFQLIP